MSDPVTTAILQQTADRLKDIGAPIPLAYQCKHKIDGKNYIINMLIIESEDNDDTN